MRTRFLIPLVVTSSACLLLAVGCFQLEPVRFCQPEDNSSSPVPSHVKRPQAEDILIEFHSVLAMPAGQQIKEFEQARADFSQSGKAEDRLRLACLSFLPGRTPADRANAAKLLDEYLADPKRDRAGLEGLAILLKMHLTEYSAVQKQVGAEKERSESLARQLNEQKTQLDYLKTQLNELKKIEKIISDREKAGLPEKP